MPRSTESQAPIVPIIGGGPAGMSCALWLHNYGLKPVIIEQADALGGMARLSPYPNAWLLGERGKPVREHAAEFAARARAQRQRCGCRARATRARPAFALAASILLTGEMPPAAFGRRSAS